MMKKKIWIVTLFPELVAPLFKMGVISKLFQNDSRLEIKFVNPREFVSFKYKSIDDSPYGGGPGMVIRPDIMKDAIEKGIISDYPEINQMSWREYFNIIYTSPRGKKWDDKLAKLFCADFILNPTKDLIFICGRYEGLDERFIQKYVDLEICLGDFILTGGELAVMAILDSALRFFPDTLGNKDSAWDESFTGKGIEAPQYTRPPVFEGESVPEILLSGDHKKIALYKAHESLRITALHRPDLLEKNQCH